MARRSLGTDARAERIDGDARAAVVCIAGFGDNAHMFAPLCETVDAERLLIDTFDLPGFGAPALDRTSLDALAREVDARCRVKGARTIVAHSVASIIASLAARREESPIRTIVSLEGNLTAEDAYFSGTAADHASPAAFREAFLARLDQMADGNTIIEGYRRRVMTADPVALWDLGREARSFSENTVPGDVLIEAAAVVYVLNPTNCPASSLAWLDAHDVERFIIDGASHWPTIDRPIEVARIIEHVVSNGLPAAR